MRGTGSTLAWAVLGEPLQDNGRLGARELRLLAHTIKRYDAAKRTKLAPLGKQSLVAVLTPALLPLETLAIAHVLVADQIASLLTLGQLPLAICH
jgi:hypothetical protein